MICCFALPPSSSCSCNDAAVLLQVHHYKSSKLAGVASPVGHHVAVSADLSLPDWVDKLADAGYDRTKPSLWLLEGLIGYLTESEATLLLTRIHSSCGPQSKVCVVEPHGLKRCRFVWSVAVLSVCVRVAECECVLSGRLSSLSSGRRTLTPLQTQPRLRLLLHLPRLALRTPQRHPQPCTVSRLTLAMTSCGRVAGLLTRG